MRDDFGRGPLFPLGEGQSLEEMAAEDERELAAILERVTAIAGDVLLRVLPAMELAHTIKTAGPLVGAQSAAAMPSDVLAFGLTEGAEKIAEAMSLYADMYSANPSTLRRPSRFALRTLPGPHAQELLLEQRAATEEESQRYADYMAQLYRTAALAINEAARAVTRGFPLEFRPPDTGVNIPTALYFWYDAAEVLLYIGITGDLATRQSSHAKRSSWAEFADHSKVFRFPSRAEAEHAERKAIEVDRPLFNHQHNATAEARARLVAYLVQHDRLDLLAPAVSRG